MRRFLILLIPLTLLLSTLAFAAGSPAARAGKFTVELSSQPSPPVVGENTLIITVKDGEKPLAGAGVDVHLDMTSMPMPADAKATPGRADGEYGATVNFSMAGEWKVDVAVQQMAGMKMDGDGTAHFLVDPGKGITAKGGARIPWFSLFTILVIAAAVVTAIFRKRIAQQKRGVVVGVLTLLIVLVGTVTVVNKYRDKKMATVIGSAMMDMSTQAAPGTVAVATETAHAAPFHATATYTGTVLPDIEEDVYPRVTGRLVTLPFYPGDTIVPGQVVAKLDSNELSAKEAQALYGNMGASQGVAAANAEVATARANREKAQRGVEQAKAQLAQMQSSARGAEQAVRAAEAEITQAEGALVQAQSDVDSAQADVIYWAAEIEREKKLYEQGAIARAELEKETAEAAAAQARLKQTRAAVNSAEAGVKAARARYAQAQADAQSANGRIIEVQAGVQTAIAEVRAAEAGISGAAAKANVATSSSLQAKAALTEAGVVRGYTVIRASSGGVVTARNISPGVLVQPGMSIMKIAKIDYVRLQANVSDADLAQIQIGQAVSAHAVDTPGKVYQGKVTAIFPARDTSARTAIVEARISNPGSQLKPGQYLSMDVSMGNTRHPAITVPTSALISRDGQTSVFVAANDGMRSTAKRVVVTTGRVSNDRTEILTGLREGDEVITSGLANLHDGDAVTAVTGNSADTATPAAAQSTTGQPTADATKWYHCPMHVDMESNKPGKCPECGMDYVVFEKK